MFQSTGPINFPCGLDSIILAGVQCFENQEDYKNFTGQAPPAYDPAIPVKLWRDTNPSRTQPTSPNPFAGFVYNMIVRDSMISNGITVYGDGVIEQAVVPGWLASRVNIPPSNTPGGGTPSFTGADQVFPIDPSIVQSQIVQSPFGISIQAPPSA